MENETAQNSGENILEDDEELPLGIQMIRGLDFSSQTMNIGASKFELDTDTSRASYEALLRANNPIKMQLKSKKTSVDDTIYSIGSSNKNNALRIFVSHSFVDKDFCTRLVKDLRAALGDESAVWYNFQVTLHSSNTKWDKVVGELKKRVVFIIILSPDAIRSSQVRYETNVALDRDMIIVPLMYRKCIVPNDLQAFPRISFLLPQKYHDAFDELLLKLGLIVKEKFSVQESDIETPKATIIQSMTPKIEAALARKHWYDVLRKVNYLIRHVQSFIPASIYRMQALALFEIGYNLLALESLDVALALMSDEKLYITLLKDYATILITLNRWFDLAKIVDEALQVNPNDTRWLEMQKLLEHSEATNENLMHMLTALLGIEEATTTVNTSLHDENSFQSTKVFVSYSHNDKRYLKRLHIHLEPYTRTYLLDVWDDTKIEIGTKWRDEIIKMLDVAKIAILLVSADFLASKFIAENELPPLMENASKKGLKILIVILSPSAFDNSPLSQFETVNSPSKPLSKMTTHEREEIWVKVGGHIKKLLDDV